MNFCLSVLSIANPVAVPPALNWTNLIAAFNDFFVDHLIPERKNTFSTLSSFAQTSAKAEPASGADGAIDSMICPKILMSNISWTKFVENQVLVIFVEPDTNVFNLIFSSVLIHFLIAKNELKKKMITLFTVVLRCYLLQFFMLSASRKIILYFCKRLSFYHYGCISSHWNTLWSQMVTATQVYKSVFILYTKSIWIITFIVIIRNTPPYLMISN